MELNTLLNSKDQNIPRFTTLYLILLKTSKRILIMATNGKKIVGVGPGRDGQYLDNSSGSG